MNIEELIEKTKLGIKDYQYWMKLEREIIQFMNSSAPEEDKERLNYKGQIEKVYMICRGYEHKTGKAES